MPRGADSPARTGMKNDESETTGREVPVPDAKAAGRLLRQPCPPTLLYSTMERESARGSGARWVENGIGPAGRRFIILNQRSSGRVIPLRARLSVVRCGALHFGRAVYRETNGRDGQIRIRGALRSVTGCTWKPVATIVCLSSVRRTGERITVNDLDVIAASGSSDLWRE